MMNPDNANPTARRVDDFANAGGSVEMPKYKCHKEVWALKIAAIEDPTKPGNESDGSAIIVPMDIGYAPFRVDGQFMHKHKPEVGGYYVVYEDGYASYSPALAFESGYTRIVVMPKHQERVVAERAELDEKRAKLRVFIGGAVYRTLGEQEQSRLNRQLEVMTCYSNILGERIAAF